MRKPKPTITRRDALYFFKLINSQTDSNVRYELSELSDVITSELSDVITNDPTINRPLFVAAMLDGFKATGERARYWQNKVLTVLRRTKAGESPAEIIADLERQAEEYQRRYVERCARKFIADTEHYTKGTREALRRALESGSYDLLCEVVNRARDGHALHPSGEPVDRLSNEWRYWKIREVEKAFSEKEAKAWGEAWDYYRDLLRGLMAEGSFWHTYFARNLLPYLIEARQHIDGLHQQERRVRAGMKGAAARQKKGGAE
jgi:hypothetical protein